MDCMCLDVSGIQKLMPLHDMRQAVRQLLRLCHKLLPLLACPSVKVLSLCCNTNIRRDRFAVVGQDQKS